MSPLLMCLLTGALTLIIGFFAGRWFVSPIIKGQAEDLRMAQVANNDLYDKAIKLQQQMSVMEGNLKTAVGYNDQLSKACTELHKRDAFSRAVVKQRTGKSLDEMWKRHVKAKQPKEAKLVDLNGEEISSKEKPKLILPPDVHAK